MSIYDTDLIKYAKKIVDKLKWNNERVVEISLKEGFKYYKWTADLSEDIRIIIYPYDRVVVLNPKKEGEPEVYLSISTSMYKLSKNDYDYKCYCIDQILSVGSVADRVTHARNERKIFNALIKFVEDMVKPEIAKERRLALANKISDNIKWETVNTPTFFNGNKTEIEKWQTRISDKVAISISPLELIAIYNPEDYDTYLSFSFSRYPYENEDECKRRAIEVIVNTIVEYGKVNIYDDTNPYFMVLSEIRKFSDKLKEEK